MEEQNRIAKLSASLDFYSGRAVAHASFLVATVFGLFLILDLRNEVPLWFSFFLYWAFSISGLYCLLNFGLYARLAEATQKEIFKPTPRRPKEPEKRNKVDVIIYEERDIVDVVTWEWKKTFIKRLFVWFKLGERHYEEPKIEENKAPLKFADFLILTYIFFAFITSLMFFAELSNNIVVWIGYKIILVIAVSDLITIIRAQLSKIISKLKVVIPVIL